MGLKESGVAGAGAMSIAQVITQPGDVLKTVVVQDNISYRGALQKVTQQSGNFGYLPPLPHLLSELTRRLWRGSIPTFYRGMIGGATFFPSLELMKLLTSPFSGRGQSFDASISFINGVGARAVAEVLTCPLFVVKTEMEYGTGSRSVPSALKTLYRNEGLPGLFKGVGPAISRGALYAGTYIALFDFNRKTFRTNSLTRDWSNYARTTLAALAASTLGTILTHPVDVVRTHLQLATAGSGGTFMSASRNLWGRLGVRGLFAGLNVKLVKRAITYSSMFPIYEVLTDLMAPSVATAAATGDQSQLAES